MRREQFVVEIFQRTFFILEPAAGGVLGKKVFLKIGVLREKLPGEIRSQNPWNIFMTKFIFRKFAGCQSATLLKINFFSGIFHRLCLQLSEHLFSRTGFSGFFRHSFCFDSVKLKIKNNWISHSLNIASRIN